MIKTIKLTWPLALLLFAFGLNSCLDDFSILGNGHQQTEDRWTTSFDEIKSSGAFEVYVASGDNYSVEVTAESNLLPYIITEVDGGKLKIRTQGIHNLHNTRPMEVYITTPVLNGLTLSGSGSIETEHFTGSKLGITISGSGRITTSVDVHDLNANISGSGKIDVTGYCNHTDLLISGSGKIKAFDLEQNSCKAKISGSGNMYVNVTDYIDVNISGSGDLHFVSTPDVHSSISGSGKVINDN